MRSFFYPPSILADVASPGMIRDFSYCFKIINLEDYPDYLFFATIKDITEIDYKDYKKKIGVEYISINADQCIEVSGDYRPVAIIWAIPKDQLISDDLMQHKNQLIEVQFPIEHPYYMPLRHRNQLIADSYTIDQLTSEEFSISRVNREQPIDPNYKPPKSPLNLFLFPIVGLMILWFAWRQIKLRSR